jgi:hypothetical protein
VTTSNRDGSPNAEVGPKSDMILKLVPAESGDNDPFDDNGEENGTDFD